MMPAGGRAGNYLDKAESDLWLGYVLHSLCQVLKADHFSLSLLQAVAGSCPSLQSVTDSTPNGQTDVHLMSHRLGPFIAQTCEHDAD